MRSVPTIPNGQTESAFSKTLSEYLNNYVPYLYVAPTKHTIVLDGHVIMGGNEGDVYSLNKDFSFSPFDGSFEGHASEQQLLPLFNRHLRFADGVDMDPVSVLLFRYARVFSDKSKWYELGVKSLNDRNLLDELITEVPNQPLSTNPNIIHFFIFINEMPAFIRMMTSENVEGDVLELFGDRGWNLTNALDVRALSVKINRATVEEKVAELYNKDRPTFVPLVCVPEEEFAKTRDEACPKPELSKQVKLMVGSIKKVRKLFEVLQANKDLPNLGYVFLLNYWMYRVFNINTLQNRFPVNKLQQVKSLMTFASDVPFDASLLRISSSGFETMETIGVYKNLVYPNCVEESVFKLFQVLSWNLDEGRFDPDLLSSTSIPLKGYLQNLNYDSSSQNPEWNDIVCALPKIKYNTNDELNIQSDTKNVLALLNTLTKTASRTLLSWAKNISKKNPYITSVEIGEEQALVINNKYYFYVTPGHAIFESVDVGGPGLRPLAAALGKETILYISFFGLLRIHDKKKYLSGIYRRPDFRLAYVKGIADLKTDESVTSFIKTPEDVMEMKKYRSLMFIASLISVPLPPGFYDGETTVELMKSFPLEKGFLPSTVKTLKMADYYDYPIGEGVLPPSLEVLDLGRSYNKPLSPNVLPEGLRVLEFGYNYNTPIESGVLPKGLNKLVFGAKFNQRIGEAVLPEGLEELTFGREFDQPIEKKMLPPTLKKLLLDRDYKLPLTREIFIPGLGIFKTV
jgi:hypothetical protein